MPRSFKESNGVISVLGDESTVLREMIGKKQLPFALTFDEAFRRYGGLYNSKFILRTLLGGKGLGLVEMNAQKLPVPPGLVLTREFWKITKNGTNQRMVRNAQNELYQSMEVLEAETQHKFGNPDNPLLVAVRSSPIRSMPGAMLTVTNVGINDRTVEGLQKRYGIIPILQAYYHLIADIMEGQGLIQNGERLTHEDLSESQLLDLINSSKKRYKDTIGEDFPQDILSQLHLAIGLVFGSYDNPKANNIRNTQEFPYSEGTACVINQMVIANVPNGGSGVMITRDPETYADDPSITYRPGAQGKSVVGDDKNKTYTLDHFPPDKRMQLAHVIKHFKSINPHNVFDLEFSFDSSEKLWLLQKREAPLSNLARLRQMIALGNSARNLTKLLAPSDVEELLMQGLDPAAVREATSKGQLIASFMNGRISPGIGRGEISHSLTNKKKFIYVGALTLDIISSSLPEDRILGIISSLGSKGSHSARHLERIGLAHHIPIAIGVSQEFIDTLEEGKFVTLNAGSSTITLFEGDIPNASADLHAYDLSFSELNLLKEVQHLSQDNQWRRFINEDSFPNFLKDASYALDAAKKKFRSMKAIQEYVKNQILPPDICEQYNIEKVDNVETIQKKLLDGLRNGNDVSLRTCFFPDITEGSEPYKIFRTKEEVTRFFRDGGYQKLINPIEGNTVSELLVGRFPKGKLDEDKKGDHAAWNYTVSDGTILINIMPGTSKMRVLGEANSDKVISYVIGPIRSRFSPTDPMTETVIQFPQELYSDNRSVELFAMIYRTIVSWERQYDLSSRLAAMEAVFPHPQYASPTLEGQARFSGNGSNKWVLVYGVNIDPINKKK